MPTSAFVTGFWAMKTTDLLLASGLMIVSANSTVLLRIRLQTNLMLLLFIDKFCSVAYEIVSSLLSEVIAH
jgi:hypothetical protein